MDVEARKAAVDRALAEVRVRTGRYLVDWAEVRLEMIFEIIERLDRLEGKGGKNA